jgi:hexosaminidase
MKKILLIASCLAFFASNVCFGQKDLSIIPYPQSLEMHSGSFKLAGASFCLQGIDENATSAIKAFASQLSFVSGKMNHFINEPKGRCVIFNVDQKLANEEYALTVTRKKVTVSASSYNGFLYAIETLKQMLPISIYGKVAAPKDKWALQCVKIQDKPRFAYRGMHLDCARHFFSVAEVKKYLDIMAIYKLNTFHWHLTEDQGWRIEIKKYPKLTQIGAFRDGTMIGHDFASNDGIRYGGFYTQDQVKDIVAYAQKLGITIIPEIDLPGHMIAALASYPELGCTGGPYKVWTRWGISHDVLCPGKEATFDFLEDVLSELMDLFPSKYIHIGGDECPKDTWKTCPDCQKKIQELGIKADSEHTAEQYLQNYVTARVQKFVNDHGRKIIGWDEILEGKLADGATVMSWRGVKGGIKAAKMGFDVIMTPNTYMYFDYLQSKEKDKEPLAIGGYLPVDTVYNYEPYKGLPESAQKHIIGVQANLWTEYISTPEHLEYNLLPRMAALSEVSWCNSDNKDFDRFKAALYHHYVMYDIMGYTYAKHLLGKIGLPGHEQPAN